MLATKVSRAAQRLSSNNTPISAATAATCTPYIAGHSTRHSHQRRRSSSKASCPPDSNNKSASSSAVSPPNAPVAQTLRTKRASKSRRLSQDKKADVSTKYEALPFVPQLNHLGEQDFGLSSFFALHRPLSVTTPLPAPVSEETFNSIFDPQSQADPWADGNSAEQRPEDVVYALSKTIEAIEEASGAAQSDILRSDVGHESTSNIDGLRHLDGAPQLKLPTLDDIIAQAKPYQVPPPPQAFPSAPPATEKKRASRSSKHQTTPRTKSYTTTITVVESEHANGEKTYEASASPIVRLVDDAARGTSKVAHPGMWTSYRSRRRENVLVGYLAGRRSTRHLSIRDPRARRRIQTNVRKPQMLLISVKRQRKLKMKKHKYKKLMKRTRSLRRRIENK